MTTDDIFTNTLINETKLLLKPNDEASFWSKVDKSTHPNECWIWTASRHYKGYGLFRANGKTLKAHRISYRFHKGRIPDGLLVCHSCDNPPCCNPAHLWLGTDKDNSDDKIAKRRTNPAKGESNGGGGKLTWSDVKEIRRLREIDKLSQQDIANKFGVSQPMVGLIVRNEKWKEEDHRITSQSA